MDTTADTGAMDTINDLVAAMRRMLDAYNSLMPGIGYIAVQDYALINDAPIEAQRAITRARDYQRYVKSVHDPRD